MRPAREGGRRTFAQDIAVWLEELGYTHCFTVAGGNSMHLTSAAAERFVVVPFTHEVSAGIAAEYFNHLSSQDKAFVLVTTGPGITNLATSVAGAWLESRPLLVLAGAVKSQDLRGNLSLRQRGIQELSGGELFDGFSKSHALYSRPVEASRFKNVVNQGVEGRKGPVVVEVCLDAQAMWGLPAQTPQPSGAPSLSRDKGTRPELVESLGAEVLCRLEEAKRPVMLIGGGVDRATVRFLQNSLVDLGVPILLTWNAADYLSAEHSMNFGRPDNWGQRAANMILQQADFVLALGSRLGLQQTGFNWQNFVPHGKVWSVNLDRAELEKGHPAIERGVEEDSTKLLVALCAESTGQQSHIDWIQYCSDVARRFRPELENPDVSPGFVRPSFLVQQLAEFAPMDSLMVASSSGTAEIAMMQNIELRGEQRLVVNSGLASMGYGLPGAIGAALAQPSKQVVCFEGDGSLAQSLSEFPMIAARNLAIKIFVLSNSGYSSIRSTQQRFMSSNYVGCDATTGLHLPDWGPLAEAFGLAFSRCSDEGNLPALVRETFQRAGPEVIEIIADPTGVLFPKVSSQLHNDGHLTSNALHEMTPPISAADRKKFLTYID